MKRAAYFLFIIILIYLPLACSRTGGIPPPPPPDPCLSVSIGLTGTVSNPTVPGASDGAITAQANGGTGFRYSINGGPFQSSGTFSNLGAGNYSITCINGDGCTGSVTFQLLDPVISCTGVNISVVANAGTNVLCEAPSATVTVTASGGTGPYMYSLNNGPYQADNRFYAVPTGNCIITAKDANGCAGTTSTTVNNAVAGPLFSQVRSLINIHCTYCHGSANPDAGINYTLPCNIVSGKAGILARAVDGQPSPMPSTGLLPASERQKIINWINAGGRYSD